MRWTGLIAAEYDEYYSFTVDVPTDHQVGGWLAGWLAGSARTHASTDGSLSCSCFRSTRHIKHTTQPLLQQVRVKLDEEWIIEHWNETGIRLDGGDPDVVAEGDLQGSYLMRSQILCVVDHVVWGT